MIDRRLVLFSMAGMFATPAMGEALPRPCAANGRFSGPVVAELMPDGRSIKLARPLTYVARCGKQWSVPAGAISDGASIPAFLWRIVGTPLVGRYRNAAVVHDWYCATRSEPSPAVHQMFYEAMLASGVSAYEAAQFYYGVRIGGPSWDDLTIANARLAQASAALGQDSSALAGNQAAIQKAQATIARDEQGVTELSSMIAATPSSLIAQASVDRLDMARARFALRNSINATGRVADANPPISAADPASSFPILAAPPSGDAGPD
jgi:hypothetical protein